MKKSRARWWNTAGQGLDDVKRHKCTQQVQLFTQAILHKIAILAKGLHVFGVIEHPYNVSAFYLYLEVSNFKG